MTISKVAARLKTEAAREPDHLYKGFIIRQDSAAKFNRPKGPPGLYFIYYSTGRRTGEAGQKTFEDAKKLVDWKIREQASVTKEQAASGPFTVKTEKNDLGKTEHYVYNGKKRLTPYKDYDVAVKEAKKLEDRAKKEESSVRGYEAYDWFAYGKPKALHLVSKGGTKVYLDKGDLFGVRKSANGKQIRMIVEKIGPTKVFTLSSDLANTLAKAAKATNAPSASRSDELEEDDGAAFKDFVEATGARLSKSLTKLGVSIMKSSYVMVNSFNTDTGKHVLVMMDADDFRLHDKRFSKNYKDRLGPVVSLSSSAPAKIPARGKCRIATLADGRKFEVYRDRSANPL